MAIEEDPKKNEFAGDLNHPGGKFEINWDRIWEKEQAEKDQEILKRQQQEQNRLEAERAQIEQERARLEEERLLFEREREIVKKRERATLQEQAQAQAKAREKEELEAAKQRFRENINHSHPSATHARGYTQKGKIQDPVQNAKPPDTARPHGDTGTQERGYAASSAPPPMPQQEYSYAARKKRAAQAQRVPPAVAYAKKDKSSQAPSPGIQQGKPKKKKGKKLLITAVALVLCYCVAVFSEIPLIEKWRTIYIETAMNTLSHHWLATAFIPQSVINKVMSESDVDALQDGMSSNWSVGSLKVSDVSKPWEKAKKNFYTVFPEIDKNSFQNYLDENGDQVFDQNGYLMIDQAGLKEDGTSMKTTEGDQVLAIDTLNGISIIRVKGDGYVGKLAIIKDPAQVSLGLAAGFDSVGSVLGEIAKSNQAVLAINGSGFSDPAGQGDGSNAYGMVISNGKRYKDPVGDSYKMIAFDHDNKLNIGQFSGTDQFRDGVEFKPALVINGQKVVSGSAGWGIAPRSVIGQTKNGQVLLLIIDGRAPGYSIGNTMEECADIMLRYGAMQACNLDGGSSSLMVYNGREITKPSAANKEIGRRLPNGFIVSGRS